mgnify:FL=1
MAGLILATCDGEWLPVSEREERTRGRGGKEGRESEREEVRALSDGEV